MTLNPLPTLQELVISYEEYLSIKFPSMQSTWDQVIFPSLNFLTAACELRALYSNEELFNEFLKTWQMCFISITQWLCFNDLTLTSTAMAYEENIVKELLNIFK